MRAPLEADATRTLAIDGQSLGDRFWNVGMRWSTAPARLKFPPGRSIVGSLSRVAAVVDQSKLKQVGASRVKAEDLHDRRGELALPTPRAACSRARGQSLIGALPID
ncbi:unnamed protein product [Phytophthora lilii]|uniref:Unnamed protein product n=1 Tax=Phytophthora lilii TaxID=2077276 RepID=A0A9W6TYK1_9STRA|nr:unnamed protein product [Phytophthora lilii]